MANNVLTPTMITREAVRVLINNLAMTSQVNRDYNDQFGVTGAKIGTTVNVRKPARYSGRTGAALSLEDHIETNVPVTLSTQYGVDVNFTSQDLTVSLDDFSQRVLAPALANVGNKIDHDGALLYKSVANWYGTPGTVPNTALAYLTAGTLLDDEACPRDSQRAAVINPIAQATIVDALKGLFQSGEKISDQYEQGTMGIALGYKFSMDQNIAVHTVGPLGGSPLVNGAQSVTFAPTSMTTANWMSSYNLVTNGWTASAAARLKKGDVIQIANVYCVNPQNRQPTSNLRSFVVTADVSSDASGNATVPIWPQPIFTGPFATCYSASNNIAAGAAITVKTGSANGLYAQNMLFHKDAFTFATADLIMPEGVHFAGRQNYKGVSMRIVRQYRIGTDDIPCRIDVLGGWAPIYPELAVRLTN